MKKLLHSLFNPEATSRRATLARLPKAYLWLALLLLGGSLPQTATAQEWRTPKGWGNSTYFSGSVRDTYFTSETTGYAVNTNGTILKTTDGGANWLVQTSGTTRSLNSVHFPSATTGYAVGDGGTILKTTDSGASWSVQTPGNTPTLYSVHFPSATTGYAVGGNGAIIKTTDGGANWSAQTSGTTQQLLGVYFTSATTGYVVGQDGIILTTTNGGTTWSPQTSGTTQWLYGVHFPTATTGYAVGSGTILKTTDGGTSWSAQTSGTTQILNSVYFTSATTGYVAGFSGILSTTNGGTTWSSQISTVSFDAVHFPTATTGYAVGSSGTIFGTTDGGANWSRQTSGSGARLNSVHFPSATTGYVVGNTGNILGTTDGGVNWSRQTPGTIASLNSVYFPSTTTGVAVGEFGAIVSTTNSGASWSAQITSTGKTLYGVSFPTATTGYAVGDLGEILKTTDGGTTWSPQTSPNSRLLNAVHFPSATTGYAVGTIGTIVSTTNGGTTWSLQTSGTSSQLRGVHFPSATTGYAVGASGTIVSTTNGGTTWSVQTSGTMNTLRSVYFSSTTTGFVVGDGGIILSTTDGGTTWSPQTSGTTLTLYGVHFPSATAGYTVGSTGTMLLYKCLSTPNIAYSSVAASYPTGTAITALTPTNTGATPTGSPLFVISPTLPAGLVLDATTGTISGTPTAATANTTYTVTTQNACGTAAATVTFATTTSSCTPTPTPTGTLVWNGSVDTDWTKPCNWTPASVPTATNDVELPSSGITNQPSIAAVAEAKSIWVKSGATLSIAATGGLTINSSRSFTVGTNTQTSSVLNEGTVQNSGQLTIGNTASVGTNGLWNAATFSNNTGGVINIDRISSVGIYNNVGGTFTNAATITIGGGNVNYKANFGVNNDGTLNNNACGQLIVKRGVIGNNASKTITNAGYVRVDRSLGNSGTFTNNGVLKYGSLSGTTAPTNATAPSVIVNDATPIFTYGGTYDGVVNGIFTDEAATMATSAGSFTAPNTFVPSGLTPGLQTLYAKITPSGGACSYVVPFAYTAVATCTTSTDPTATLVWNGSVDTDWAKPCNWTPASVPTATNDVEIPATGVTNFPIISAAALAKSVWVKTGATLSISATGSLTINDSRIFGNDDVTDSFYNQGTVQNSGQLTIGSTAFRGIINFNATFNNNEGGNIKIDNTTRSGLVNDGTGTFTNGGTITIGSLGSVGFNGIFNKGPFNNNTGGIINIDRSTNTGLYNDRDGAFTNVGTITIGGSASVSANVGSNGLQNLATFNNNTGGIIKIDKSTYTGLQNEGAFTNAATLTIGGSAPVGFYGIYTGNNSNATFNNNAGGSLKIDNSTNTGLYISSGTFTNAAAITIGGTASVGDVGLYNYATFNNNACAKLIVKRGKISNYAAKTITNTGYVQVDGELANAGTFTNNGVLKYGTTSGAGTLANATAPSVIVNNNPTNTTIFTYGGTYNGVVNGIFKDEAATMAMSAGTFTAPNTFAPSGLTAGLQTLYAKITPSGGACSYVVPFAYTAVASTTTSLVSSLNPSFLGQSVTFTATVLPSTATGTVTFKNGTTTLGTGTLNSSGVATYSTTTLSVATHSITAVYGGDANNATSTSDVLSQVVNANNTITLSSAAGTNAQTKCINTAITNITYATTGATGATFSGLPTGVSGAWANNVVTISGTPSTATGSPFGYTVTLTGGSGTGTATGTITVTAANTITLSSAAGTNAQTKCINTAITNITYATTGATGATFSGLPTGVTGAWAGNVATISGTPTTATGSPFGYTVTLTGGCGAITATGTITVTPNNTVTLSSAAGTNAQTKCINTAITNITYATTGATGATFSGLPTGVTGAWASNVVTISGTPTTATGSPFGYTVTLTGGCGATTASGTIGVTTPSAAPTVGTIIQPTCTTATGGVPLSGLPTVGSWTLTRNPGAVSSTGTGATTTVLALAANTYTFTVTNADGCVSAASNNVVINVQPATPTTSNVTGGGLATCGTGVAVGLSASQTATTYQLRKDGIDLGSPVAGTGFALAFGLQNAAGTYSVVATASTGGCTATMTGSVAVTVLASISSFSVSGGGVACGAGSNSGTGGAGVGISLSGSQIGVSYQLRRGTINSGTAVAGTGSALNFPNQSIAGTYTVVATAGTCPSTNMSGSAVVTVGALPVVYNVTGGGTACGTGSVINLSNSQTGVNYQLKRGTTNVGAALAGTGAALVFAKQTVVGSYGVEATNASTACVRAMSGTASITACAARQGVEESNDNADWAVIAPNPVVSQVLELQVRGVAQQRVSWQLVNLQGKTLSQSEFEAQGNIHCQAIGVEALPAGTYILQLQSQSKKANLKVVKAD